MKLSSPAVLSSVYQLVRTVEFDLELGEKFFSTRVEVFQDTQRKRHFRCHMWELEYYHVESTFAREGKGRKKRVESDEPFLVERTWELSGKFHDFEAPNAKAALKKFLDLLQRRLSRESGKPLGG